MTTLGTIGRRFTIGGVPTFLLGYSYYDVLNWVEADLDAFVAHRVNLLRAWMCAPTTWSNTGSAPGHSALNTSGNWVSSAESDAVLAFVNACDARGIICDIVIANGGFDSGFPINNTQAVRQQAVTTVGTLLAAKQNVMFDFANEHTDSANTDATYEGWDLPATLEAVAPGKLWYFGDVSDHMIQKNVWTVSAGQRATIALHHDTWGEPVMSMNMADATDANWFNEIKTWYDALRAELVLLGKEIPIYMYEPPWGAVTALGGDFVTAHLWRASIERAQEAGFAGYVIDDIAGVWLVNAPVFPTGHYPGGFDAVKAHAVLQDWATLGPLAASMRVD